MMTSARPCRAYRRGTREPEALGVDTKGRRRNLGPARPALTRTLGVAVGLRAPRGAPPAATGGFLFAWRLSRKFKLRGRATEGMRRRPAANAAAPAVAAKKAAGGRLSCSVRRSSVADDH